jgi:hypothetical protein
LKRKLSLAWKGLFIQTTKDDTTKYDKNIRKIARLR